MKRSISGAVAALIALAAPAQADDKPGLFAPPGEKLAYLVSSWESRDAEALTAAWGEETRTGRRGSNTLLIFERTSNVRTGLTGFGRIGVTARRVECRATFELTPAGSVVSGSYRATDPKVCWKLFRDNAPP